jgi:hypothetical protein
MPRDIPTLAVAAGLACTGTLVASAVISSLPLMGVAAVGGLAATAAALNAAGDRQPSRARTATNDPPPVVARR